MIALWEKCGLTGSWNNLEKDIASKNSDQNGEFLIGQIDGVLVVSIMIGYDRHPGRINYFAVDPDHSGAGYGKILMVEAPVWRMLLSYVSAGYMIWLALKS